MANASDVYAKSQVDRLIPDLGAMHIYDDDTETGRGIISHPTALHSVFAHSMAPIIMKVVYR